MAQRVSWKGELASPDHCESACDIPAPLETSKDRHQGHGKSSSLSQPRPKHSRSADLAASPEPENDHGSPESSSEDSSASDAEATITVTEPPADNKPAGLGSSTPIPSSISISVLPSSPTFSPLNVQRFTTIASGHSDFFKLDGDKLAKPCNPHEAKLYRAAPCWGLSWQPFMDSCPRQLLRLVSPLSLTASKMRRNDLTHGFTHPCVMDLKMGTSQSTRSQSAAKKKWRSAKVNATTSAKLGVRLGGIRVYKPYLKEWTVRKGNYGKRLTESTFMDALNLFFNDGRRTRLELISCFIQRLKSFLFAMEAARVDFDFIASSVLLVYEGNYDRSSFREKHAPPRCEVRLIDFDHTVIKAEQPDSKNDDSGAGIGLRNLIHNLEILLFSHTRTHSFTELPDVKLTAVVEEVKKVPDSDEMLLKLMPAQPKKESIPRLRRVNSQP